MNYAAYLSDEKEFFFLDWVATYLLIAVKLSMFFCIKWDADYNLKEPFQP